MGKRKKIVEPDNTAERTALWRALHIQVDAKPHILEDEIGLKLIAPNNDWKERPDMKFTKRLRASIIARARFIEDLIIEQSQHGIAQYVILGAGFETNKPAVVVCTGVTLYLTKDAIISTLNQIATLVSGSKLAMTFYLPIELLDEEDKPMQEMAEKGARAAGTPFISFFTLNEILALARETGLKEAKTISTKDLEQLYFANRIDNLLPASGEVFLLATT